MIVLHRAPPQTLTSKHFIFIVREIVNNKDDFYFINLKNIAMDNDTYIKIDKIIKRYGYKLVLNIKKISYYQNDRGYSIPFDEFYDFFEYSLEKYENLIKETNTYDKFIIEYSIVKGDDEDFSYFKLMNY